MPKYYWVVVTSEGVPSIFRTQKAALKYAQDLCKSHTHCKVWSCEYFDENKGSSFLLFDSRA